MARIFSVLAAFAVLLLVANVCLGLMTGDYNGVAAKYQVVRAELMELETDRESSADDVRQLEEQLSALGRQLTELDKMTNIHLLTGIAASLVTLLVNSVTVTYFIGTARWCQEVVDTYQLGDELISRSRTLKRRTFPWALAGIMTLIAIIILGGAAHPLLANAAHASHWVTPHLWAAMLGTFFIGWSFLIQIGNIRANYEVIEEVMAEVARARARHATLADGPAVELE